MLYPCHCEISAPKPYSLFLMYAYLMHSDNDNYNRNTINIKFPRKQGKTVKTFKHAFENPDPPQSYPTKITSPGGTYPYFFSGNSWN